MCVCRLETSWAVCWCVCRRKKRRSFVQWKIKKLRSLVCVRPPNSTTPPYSRRETVIRERWQHCRTNCRKKSVQLPVMSNNLDNVPLIPLMITCMHFFAVTSATKQHKNERFGVFVVSCVGSRSSSWRWRNWDASWRRSEQRCCVLRALWTVKKLWGFPLL